MRAPPDVANEMSGTRSRMASSAARQNFSPTTDPMLAPAKEKSMKLNAVRSPSMAPKPVMMASFRPVFF